jgi:hypothetical protein
MKIKPSDEQKEIIYHISQGNHVMVNAVAGSGKSTTILSIADAFPEKQILQITYNSMLRHEMKEKVTKMGLKNLSIHTFHSLAVKFYLESAYTDTEIRHILLHNIEFKDSLTQPLDILVLDEAQDMSLLYFQFIWRFLENLIVVKKDPKIIVVLGDHQQCLYQFKGADPRFLTMAPKIWVQHPCFQHTHMISCNLKTSYRITTPMASFVNKVMLGENRMIAPRDGQPVVYIRNTRYNIEKTVIYLIQQLLFEGNKPSDIFILAGSVKGVNSHIRKMENLLCENGIPCHIPTMEQDKLDERVIDGKIVFSTFHCVKGRQRKFVFVVGFDHNYFLHMAHGADPQVCPNTLYVGCTRASECLYLLEFDQFLGDRPLEFLKMTHHDMVQSDFIIFKGIPQLNFYLPPSDTTNGSTANMIKKQYLSPTKLIKFISDGVMDIIVPLIETIFHCENKPLNICNDVLSGSPITNVQQYEQPSCINTLLQEIIGEPVVTNDIPIPNIVQTRSGFEDISDLNGIAIPAMFYDKLSHRKSESTDMDSTIENGDESKTNVLYSLIQEALDDMRENEHQYFKDIVKTLPKICTTIEDYLYMANIYVSIQERLYFKLKQIRREEYGWLTEEMMNQCYTLLDKVIGIEIENEDNVFTEELIVRPSMENEHLLIDNALIPIFVGTELENTRFRFTAIVDLITPTTVWEIKCTTKITIDHQLQLIIYAWLWNVMEREPRNFKLLNIKSGEIWVLEATQHQLQHIVLTLLKGKYAHISVKNDNEFLQLFSFKSSTV